jgi:hypothetical protein
MLLPTGSGVATYIQRPALLPTWSGVTIDGGRRCSRLGAMLLQKAANVAPDGEWRCYWCQLTLLQGYDGDVTDGQQWCSPRCSSGGKKSRLKLVVLLVGRVEGKNRGGRGTNGWAHTHVTPLFFIRKDTHQMLDAGIRTSDPRGLPVLKRTKSVFAP